MSPINQTQSLMTVGQVAELLYCSNRHVYRLRDLATSAVDGFGVHRQACDSTSVIFWFAGFVLILRPFEVFGGDVSNGILLRTTTMVHHHGGGSGDLYEHQHPAPGQPITELSTSA